jgi:PAS domain S-box-containing protein
MASMADGVVVVDKNGNILMMNPQAEAISGHPLSELSGKKIFDLPQIENQVVSLAKEINSENKENISKDINKLGTASMLETVKKSTAIIQNEDGKIVGSVSIPTDAAKFKQMEQLQQDFISNMTHELRSPLTSIKAALEIMSREAAGPGESSRNILNTAIRNTERLNSIITDILDFSKLQSGKLIFHQEGTPPDEIAREAADAMKAWAESKGVTLTVTNEPDLPQIYADKRRTVQILINLISNAIKFTPQGGLIEVSADSGRDALANFVFFSVKDNGCGIKKEEQEKIFEKFVQVAAGEKVGGTGLGLAITKAMAVLQGGRITVESDAGRGSVFRVGLPLYKGQGDQSVFEPGPEAKELSKPWWKKILDIS